MAELLAGREMISPILYSRISVGDRLFALFWARRRLELVYNAVMAFRAQGNPNAGKRGRTPPPEETFEEASFLKALGEKQKTVRLKLMDGQRVSGWIEYYDKHMVRLTREGAPNLFIFKHEIMYIEEDGGGKK
jgi:host factor-I protein